MREISFLLLCEPFKKVEYHVFQSFFEKKPSKSY
jgi:hypothetical protein